MSVVLSYRLRVTPLITVAICHRNIWDVLLVHVLYFKLFLLNQEMLLDGMAQKSFSEVAPTHSLVEARSPTASSQIPMVALGTQALVRRLHLAA